MANAVLQVALWVGIIIAIAISMVLVANPRTSLEIAKAWLDTLQGVGERIGIVWTQAQAWRWRRSYKGQHRAPRFSVTAPVLIDE